MGGFNFGFNWGQSVNPLSVERDRNGNWFYRMFSSGATFTSLTTDREKLKIILTNPACLKVFKLNADLGSLGKVSSYTDKGEFVEINALRNKQAKPNKHQTWKQFFWDYFFYNPLGTAYLWRSNNTDTTFSPTSFYWLNPAKMNWRDIENKLDKLDLSDKAVNDIEKLTINYQFRDGSSKDIPLKEIQPFTNLSNSVSENWYKGNSAIDALYKVISNSEQVLDAENVNLDFSKKFFMSGEQDSEDIYNTPMTDLEKKSIREKVHGEENVHVTKSKVSLSRFVDDLAKLKLDEAYLGKYFIIGSMFGIPRDVLEANIKGGSTYENQEKSTGKHISYSIQPMADDLMEWFGDFMKTDFRMEYKHLPFMQIFEKDRADTVKVKADAFAVFVANGITKEEALKLTGLDL